MPVKAHRLGAGTLTLGETGTLQEFGSQCTAMKVTPSLNEEDAIPVLSGEELSGDDTIDWNISGTLLQSFDKEGIIYWAKKHSLQELPFKFDPSTADSGFTVEGTVKVVPLEMGGDVKKRNTTDFEFKCVGEPNYVDKTPGE